MSQKHSRLTWSWVFYTRYSASTAMKPWTFHDATWPVPPCQSSSNTGSSLYHHKTCISNIRHTSDIFFRLFPHIYRLYLFYWCFPDNGSPVIIIFLDYMSSINLFSFNKAINNSVLRCVTYSSGAVEVYTIYQLWSNKNSLVCL